MMNVRTQLARLKKEIKATNDAKEVINTINVKEHIAPVYYDLHEYIKSCKYRYYNLPGGRGSGKSSFCALEIVNGVMQSADNNAIVFRRTANTMRESVYSQIAWAIDVLQVNHLWHGSISPMSFTYKPTGAQILFRGLDDTSKLKSIKARHGHFKYIWFEEFSELPGENFTRSVLQSVQRGTANTIVFRSFNPPINASNWANVLITRADDRAITLHTSYLDIPQEWLGEDFITEAERLKAINEKAYNHEYLGEATGTGGEVFPNIEKREITAEDIANYQYTFAGVDFGFSVDPAVFILLAYDSKTDTIYFLNEIYKKHLSNKQLADEIKKLYLDKDIITNFMGYPEAMHIKQNIICDSAEPKSIDDLRGEGLKATACKKYAGSVLYGVKWLQNRRLVIDPKRTPHTYEEFVKYEYMTTKDGEFLADVPDKDNHTIDATRYALDKIINKKQYSA